MRKFISKQIMVLAMIIATVTKTDEDSSVFGFAPEDNEKLKELYPEGFEVHFGGHEPAVGDAIIFGKRADGSDDVYLCPKDVFEAKYEDAAIKAPTENSSNYAPHQQRVVNEKDELDSNINSLESFFEKDLFTGLDEQEQARMFSQHSAMKQYSDILGERIAHF